MKNVRIINVSPRKLRDRGEHSQQVVVSKGSPCLA